VRLSPSLVMSDLSFVIGLLLGCPALAFPEFLPI